MPILALLRLMIVSGRRMLGLLGVLGLVLPACQSRHEAAEMAASPPVGHYEGSLAAAGKPELRAALDIRHPSPGHYEAELTVPAVGTLSFMADTIFFNHNQLRLVRPARPGQTLTLTLDGDFWRGTLALDSAKAAAILLKRGLPSPSAYRVAKVPQVATGAELFAPTDTSTPGAALLLLPDVETSLTAALWADALAREGIIVLLLPAADSVAEASRWRAALRLLHQTAGADTASIGVWAVGQQGVMLAQSLAAPNSPHAAFFITQNAEIDVATRAAVRELRRRKLPVLGLYGGPAAAQRATGLRNALSGRRGSTVRIYRMAGTNLLLPGGGLPQFGPGLPKDVIEWLRNR